MSTKHCVQLAVACLFVRYRLSRSGHMSTKHRVQPCEACTTCLQQYSLQHCLPASELLSPPVHQCSR